MIFVDLCWQPRGITTTEIIVAMATVPVGEQNP